MVLQGTVVLLAPCFCIGGGEPEHGARGSHPHPLGGTGPGLAVAGGDLGLWGAGPGGGCIQLPLAGEGGLGPEGAQQGGRQWGSAGGRPKGGFLAVG